MNLTKLITISGLTFGGFTATTLYANANAQAVTIPKRYRGNWKDGYGDKLKVYAHSGYMKNTYSHWVKLRAKRWGGNFWKYALVEPGRPMATQIIGYKNGHLYVKLGTSAIKQYRY